MAIRNSLRTLSVALCLLGFVACSLATGGLKTGGDGVESACFDGKDDDDDGAVDCDDPDCNAVALCAEIREGWTVVRAKTADPSQPPALCADGSMATRYLTEPAGAPTCEACTCGELVNARCSVAEMSCFYENMLCEGRPDFTAQMDDGSCFNINNVPAGDHPAGFCRISVPAQPAAGSCPSSGGALIPSPSWGGAMAVCSFDASGCEAGMPCELTDATEDGAVCITRAGPTACPEGWPKATTGYSSGEDQRSCSPCGCSVGCPDGGYTVYDGVNCFGDEIDITSSSCTMLFEIFDQGQAAVRLIPAMPVAICAQSKAMGQVVPQGMPQQICCK
jgi:hypothetical protein